jgi:hypothetical protein
VLTGFAALLATIGGALALLPEARMEAVGADAAEDGLAPSTLVGSAHRETRATLDPAAFTGTVARAYQVAREIPDVLDQLTCYCACRSQYGHVSLLSCYTDGHGST